jgi:hypothetical protein
MDPIFDYPKIDKKELDAAEIKGFFNAVENGKTKFNTVEEYINDLHDIVNMRDEDGILVLENVINQNIR